MNIKKSMWICLHTLHTFKMWLDYSHKKWKDSLDGSLDRVLLATELEFSKMLVPRLPQHTSNVNIEYSLYVTSFLEH